MDTISFGESRAQIIAILGSPIKETSRDGMSILWYRSQTPSKATFVYLKSDTLIAQSKDVQSDGKRLQYYVDLYGMPEYSVHRFGKEVVIDTPTQYIFAWPTKGILIVSNGTAPHSTIEREDIYVASSLPEFLMGFGKNLVSHETATVAAAQLNPTVSVRKLNQVQGSYIDPWIIPVSIVLLIMAMLAVRYARLRKNK